MAEFVIVMGFFLVMLIEQVVLEFGIGGNRASAVSSSRRSSDSNESTPLLLEAGRGDDSSGDHGRQRTVRGHGTFDGQQRALTSPGDAPEVSVVVPGGATENSVAAGGDEGFASEEERSLQLRRGREQHSHHHHMVLDHSSLRSYLLLLALTFHSVFEGLAIGLQQVSGQLFSIFTAVIIHKAIMAFSLGEGSS